MRKGTKRTFPPKPCVVCGQMMPVTSGRSTYCSWRCALDSRLETLRSGCVVWTGTRDKAGYGVVTLKNTSQKAHRLSWSMVNGAIPKGLFVCHKCDHPPCCNPDHLFIGTAQDNTSDKVTKGRQQRGADTFHAKLKPKQVRAIRTRLARGETATAIAKLYGVASQSIDGIAEGRYWAWLYASDGLDASIKGARQRRGESHPRSKLTEDDVREIRRLAASKAMFQREIAKQFGVSIVTVEKILAGTTWAWLK